MVALRWGSVSYEPGTPIPYTLNLPFGDDSAHFVARAVHWNAGESAPEGSVGVVQCEDRIGTGPPRARTEAIDVD